jgi:hypothetical protein
MTGTLSPARRRVGPLKLTVQVKRLPRPIVIVAAPGRDVVFVGSRSTRSK